MILAVVTYILLEFYANDDGGCADVAVFEGERSNTGGNTQIGEFIITGAALSRHVISTLAFLKTRWRNSFAPLHAVVGAFGHRRHRWHYCMLAYVYEDLIVSFVGLPHDDKIYHHP